MSFCSSPGKRYLGQNIFLGQIIRTRATDRGMIKKRGSVHNGSGMGTRVRQPGFQRRLYHQLCDLGQVMNFSKLPVPQWAKRGQPEYLLRRLPPRWRRAHVGNTVASITKSYDSYATVRPSHNLSLLMGSFSKLTTEYPPKYRNTKMNEIYTLPSRRLHELKILRIQKSYIFFASCSKLYSASIFSHSRFASMASALCITWSG